MNRSNDTLDTAATQECSGTKMRRLTDDEVTRIFELTEFFSRLRWTDAPLPVEVPTPNNYAELKAESWRQVFQHPLVVEARKELAQLLQSSL
jgi:hypothetical protein